MHLSQSFDYIERYLAKLWRSDEVGRQFEHVTFNEYDYLKAVQHLGQPRLSDLAAEMRVQKSSASTMVAKLERRDLLKRTPCPDDRRSTRVSLTGQGEALMALEDKLFGDMTRKICAAMSEEEYQILETLLDKACRCLQDNTRVKSTPD